MVIGVLSLVVGGPLLGLPAMLLSIGADREIARSHGKIGGSASARIGFWAGLVGSLFGLFVFFLVLMPVIGKLFGGLDFSSYFLTLGPVPAALQGSTDYAGLKKAGVPLLGYGEFITQAVNFLIVAFIVFLIIRSVNRFMPKPEVSPAVDPADVVLLREIRDELRRRP